MYYIILSKVGEYKPDFYNYWAGDSLYGTYHDKNKKVRFPEDSLLCVYSGENTLEELNGKQLNDAINFLGFEHFINLSNTGIVSVSSINMLTDELGIVLSDETLHVAYMGYVYKFTSISKLVYVQKLDNILEISFCDTKGIKEYRTFDITGIIEKYTFFNVTCTEVGEYKDGKAGVALCKAIIL